MLLIIETEGGVVDLLEPPVSEEATPLPSSHDVLVQNVRLQKAFNRLGLVTQQVELYFLCCVFLTLAIINVSLLMVQKWYQDWSQPFQVLWPLAPVP